jgi:hypothetical protein
MENTLNGEKSIKIENISDINGPKFNIFVPLFLSLISKKTISCYYPFKHPKIS